MPKKATKGVVSTEVQVATNDQQDQKDTRIIERVMEDRTVAIQDTFGKLTRSQVDLMKRTVAKGATDDELKMFIQVCKGSQLNPFLKQVHFVKRWDSREGREVGAIQVGIDGFRSIAESSNQYAGNDDPIFDGEKEIEYGKDPKKKITVPVKATVTVYKLMEGQKMAFSATARWDEYYPGERIGFQWHNRPYLMLGKCAEALALRKAFPKLLSGMYAQEEMEKTVQYESADERQQKGFQTLMSALEKATLEELEEYKTKMNASDKYDAKQKFEYITAVENRIEELRIKESR